MDRAQPACFWKGASAELNLRAKAQKAASTSTVQNGESEKGERASAAVDTLRLSVSSGSLLSLALSLQCLCRRRCRVTDALITNSHSLFFILDPSHSYTHHHLALSIDPTSVHDDSLITLNSIIT